MDFHPLACSCMAVCISSDKPAACPSIESSALRLKTQFAPIALTVPYEFMHIIMGP